MWISNLELITVCTCHTTVYRLPLKKIEKILISEETIHFSWNQRFFVEIDHFRGENHVLFSEIFFQTRIHVRGLWLTCNLLPKQTQFVTGFKLLETKIGQAVDLSARNRPRTIDIRSILNAYDIS